MTQSSAATGAETIAGGPGIDDIRGGVAWQRTSSAAARATTHSSGDKPIPLLPTTDSADTIDGDEGNETCYKSRGNASQSEHSGLVLPPGSRALLRRDSQVLSPVQLDLGTIESLFVQLGQEAGAIKFISPLRASPRR